jgi:hypothetical protein
MGLGLMLVATGAVYLRTKDPRWRQRSWDDALAEDVEPPETAGVGS